MKTLLFLLLLYNSAPAQINYGGIGHSEKHYQDSTGKYIVAYDFDPEVAMVPAVSGAQPHYDAIITVYKLVQLRCFCDSVERFFIASFPGQYVRNGCFEDLPVNHVKKALAEADKRNKRVGL